MQPEVLQSYQQDLDQGGLYSLKTGYDDYDFNYSSITTPEDSSIVSSDSYSYFQTNISNLSYFSDHTPVLPIANISQHVEEIEENLESAFDDVLRWLSENEEMKEITTNSITMETEDVCSHIKSIDMVLPPEDMEFEGQTSFCNLLKAYGEATEMGHQELAKVIALCINAKASPFGGTMERVAANLFQPGNQVEYIKQESMKNFKLAFKAFYEIFPYGRFPHFVANSAILEAVMSYYCKVHIIDFDMGEGVQWPSLLEAIGKLKRGIKLTSIRTNNLSYSFEETKNRLNDYANGCRFKLEVQDIKIEDLESEIERSREHDEFLAFNCMVGLPHMGRTRNRSEVMQFVRIAKKLLLTNKGIVTFGDGEDLERKKDCSGFGSFFDNYIMHYYALCESMERSLLENHREARVAMESLFVWPYISSWRNVREDYEFKENIGLVGWRMSKESVMEVKEMVNEKLSSYNIRVEGKNNNEMVLEWRGTPLVRVSAWI